MNSRPFPLLGVWSLSVATFAFVYFVWTPWDVPVRALGDAWTVLAVGVAAGALAAIAPYALVAPSVGSEGRRINLVVTWLIVSLVVALATHGGLLGPRDYTGNFPFRFLVVIAALAAGHRLGATGFVTPRMAKLVGSSVVLMVGGMMAYALALGVVANNYATQGVNPVGTASGDAVQAYLLAYAAPLVFYFRTGWIRSSLYLLAVGAVALTFRRGPLVCVLAPIALLPFFDKRRSSGRRWQLDIALFAAAAFVAVSFIGFDRVFARWIALVQGEAWALSERDLIYPILGSQLMGLDFELMFGHGVGSTVQFLNAGLGRPIFAHNDWLEVATSFGLFGLAAFVLLHTVLVRGVYGALRVDRYTGLVALALYLQFAMSNWIEGLLYAAQHGALLMFFLGASLGSTIHARERSR